MLGVSFDGDLYRVHSADGSASAFAASGYTAVNAMTKSQTGDLYATGIAGSQAWLFRIDPATGLTSAVTATNLDSVRGLAFLNGTLFAIQDGGSGTDLLYTLDPVTGAESLIGTTSLYGLQALAVVQGVLYGWDVDQAGLVRIHPATAQVQDVNPSLAGGSAVQGMCVSPNGHLYGVHRDLQVVNPLDGSRQTIGSVGRYDLRGIEFPATGGPFPFTLSRTGSCPGRVTLDTANGTPLGSVALLHGAAGSFVQSGQPCAGLQIGIASPSLGSLRTADGSGGSRVAFDAVAAWCGRTVQAVDVGSCAASGALTL